MKRNILFSAVLLGLSMTSFASEKKTDENIILPPSWTFGVMYGGYTNQEETINRVDSIIKKDYPIDAYWIDSWFWDYGRKGKGPHKYMDFVADTIGYPDRAKMWSHLEKNNVKGGFWVWNCIFELGNEEAFNDFKDKGHFSNTYRESNPWHNGSQTTAMFETSSGPQKKGTLCGNINFNSPQTVAYFKEKMKHFFDEGADFIKLDRTSDIQICKTMFEMSQEFGKESKGRGFILSHSFGCESEDYKRYPGKWTDDTRSDWTIESPTKEFDTWVPKVAFKENIAMYTDLSKKTSQIPFLTQDLGGFDMGKTDVLDEELYIRWMQFAMFCPVVEIFCQPENKTANLAYSISHRADTLFRQYAHLRMQLFPYIYTYAHLTRLEGENMMKKTEGKLYEYGFGNEFFVAPVYEQYATKRSFDLPQGEWYNFWTDAQVKGGRSITVDAPVDQIPLFVKSGSIIPMRPYASSIEKGSNDTLNIHLYPGNGSFELIEDDGKSNDYLKGKIAKTKITQNSNKDELIVSVNPVSGTYDGIVSERVIKLIIHGGKKLKSVSINGKKERSAGNNETSYFLHEKNKSLNVRLKLK